MDQEQTLHMDEVNIRTVLKDLFFNLPIIILAVCIALMGVRIYKNIVFAPQYTSSTTMAVMAKGNASGDVYASLQTASSMAEVFTEVFQSDVMKEKVAEAIGEMPEGVTITPKLIPETNLLELHVTAADPKTSYQVMLAVLENYGQVSDYLFGNAVLEIIADPQVPTAPSNSFNTTKMDILAVFAVLVLVGGVIVLFSVLRKTIKTPKAAHRNMEGKHLVTLPYEEKNRTLKAKLKKVNKAVILGDQILNFRYEESCHELAAVVERILKKQGKNSILVTSVAENEGKSTVCVNLAVALAQRHKKVLLIDSDFAKPAVHKLLEMKIRHNKSIKSIVQNNASLKPLIQYDEKHGIYVILNAQDIKDCQRSLNSEILRKWIREAQKNFDYVLIDSAPIIAGTDVEYLKDYVDGSILVVRQDIADIADINDTIEMLRSGESEFFGYVLNAFDTKGGPKYGHYGYYRKYSAGVEE